MQSRRDFRCQSQVRDLYPPILSKQTIFWFQISIYVLFVMQSLQTEHNSGSIVLALPPGEPALLMEMVPQVATSHQVKDQEYVFF
mmetsp:Transcript_12077/g.20478  ORF Transcript_12077/g.20478 Transcript_12077/m.20478 type:complete len:85 (-) Transcript_12077:195-449(-)